MTNEISIDIGDHLSKFVESMIKEKRFKSADEVVKAGLRLLEEDEIKLSAIRSRLSVGESELNQGEDFDGKTLLKT